MRVFVDGWTGTPRSYAIVNEAQIAAMREHGDFEIVGEECAADIAYRIRMPLDLRQAGKIPMFVFATCEAGFLPQDRLAAGQKFGQLDVRIVTPSDFSRQGLIRTGIDPDRIAVIPHGVDRLVFSVTPVDRDPGPFVFLNVSTMDNRKGTDTLLRAFARVAMLHPDARLVLKGCDQIHPSRRLVEHYIAQMRADERRAIAGKVRYVGGTLDQWQMAALYRSADCYVTPYRAEAFNLPALEALACGVPIICTAGGPTDAFIEGQIALRIEAKTIPLGPDGQQVIFEPDEAHLAGLMVDMLQHPERREEQAKSAVRCLGWDAVAVQLQQLFSRHC